MKKILENKKVIIPVVVLCLLIIGIVLYLILTKDNEQENKLKEETYTMYIKINPLVKMEFKESYYICIEDMVEKACSDKTNEITNYELINDDAKEIYKDIDLKGLSLIDALVKIYDTARDKNLEFDTIEIVANYKFDSENLTDEIKTKSKYNVTFNINTIFNEELNEDVINTEEYYTITFDSDGGSTVEAIKIAKGNNISKPSNPTKDGYTFVEWQLDSEKYNFEDKITSDITLTAKWKKNEESSKKDENIENSKKDENKKENNESTTKPVESTSVKINLNDNVKVSKVTESTGSKDCFFYMFATNLKTLFPNADIKGTSKFAVPYWAGSSENRQETEIAEEMLTDNLNSIKFDSNKENNLLNILSKYKNGKYKGIANVEYSSPNHRISYSFDYLEFADSSYKSDGLTASLEIGNALNGSTLFMGTCGGFDYSEDVVLTEELCSEFNLECGRW